MSTKEKIDVAKKRIEDINLEIEALVARKLPGRLGIIPDANGNDVEVAHIEAKKLIEETEASRIRASTDCGCDSPPIDKKLQNTCTMLKRSTKDEGGGVGAVNFRKAR